MTEETPDTPPAPAKVDPETLVLRGRPGRVVRFRRGAIVAIAALGSTAIVAVAWIALKPATFAIVASEEDRVEPATIARSDTLTDAPKSYGEVPMLGPPLPGDLGRPVLEHQRSLAAAEDSPVADPAAQAAQAAEAERQRAIAERKAARESGVIVQMSGKGSGAPALPALASATAPQIADEAAEQIAFDPAPVPDGQQREANFGGDSSDLNPHGLAEPVSPWTITAGSVIAASLITGLNSDLPGLVTAQVTENVYDSAIGKTLLIPQGSRLVGRYDSVVAFGQSRAMVVWQRIILPDSSSVRIDNMPAADTAGYAGLTDKVDMHTWQLLKGVALSTLLGAGTELSIGGDGDLVEAIRESAQTSTARAGDQLVMRNLNVQPTLKVRPGWPLRILVHKDLVLRPWAPQGE